DLNHVQKAEPIDALCTKFDLNYVQSAENNTRIFHLLGVARTRRPAM
ncbi:hypothetical protein HMPREF1580_00864, partial [Gardnerella vaginalis JCP8070]